MAIELVPIPELPPALLEEALSAISPFSISMVISDDTPASQIPCAGVLVTIGDRRGILTARHVATEIVKHDKLFLLMGERRYRISTTVLSPCYPPVSAAENPWRAPIPDIAFVPLPPKDIVQIETYGKVFYSVDRRADAPAFNVHGDDGFFVVIGNPKALVRSATGQLIQLRFVTDVGKRIDIEEWDYVTVNLNIEDHHLIPDNQEGMSGGGLWRAKMIVGKQSGEYKIVDPSHDVTLSGLVFWQTELQGRQLVAHGSKSIYSSLRTVVTQRPPSGGS